MDGLCKGSSKTDGLGGVFEVWEGGYCIFSVCSQCMM